MAKKKKKSRYVRKGLRPGRPAKPMTQIDERNTPIGDQLTTLRLAAGYSMAQAAKKVPCCKQLIHQIETGVNLPSHRMLLRLAYLYGGDEVELRKTLAKQQAAKTRNRFGFK